MATPSRLSVDSYHPPPSQAVGPRDPRPNVSAVGPGPAQYGGFRSLSACHLLHFVLGTVLALTAFLADRIVRVHSWGVARAGLAAGLGATIIYDVTRAILGQLDPSPFDPFGAIRIFGTLLVGSASNELIMTSGIALHLINGTCFGLSYAALFGRDGQHSTSSAVVTGISWGLFLELFQATLYPEWLRIAALNEFLLISVLSHVAFGLSLGLLSRRYLRRWAFDPFWIG